MPELSFTFEPRPALTATVVGHDCPKPVPGAVVNVTAKGIAEAKEVMIAVRVRMDTRNGPSQNMFRARVLMYPAPTPAPALAKKGE